MQVLLGDRPTRQVRCHLAGVLPVASAVILALTRRPTLQVGFTDIRTQLLEVAPLMVLSVILGLHASCFAAPVRGLP